ncbi:MAG: RNA 2',3'-cyclic phosphodiesterase [Candidatus Bathyarchaeota archaeon]|nr:MAG: RNA 2',3'-cyclic phosphodiesterase [Candidatus Bathyarchaeota archaeon]
MSESIRSFIAFDIDNKEILMQVAQAQDKLRETGANLKFVQPENIHITMRFLGNIQPSMIDRIYNEMKNVTFSPFDVNIRGLGAFPSRKYARVVWAGITKGADELEVIFSQLEPRLRKLGFKPDLKGFRPHITIARVRTGRNKVELARFIREYANHEFGVLRVECLKLKQSILMLNGPLYSTLKETHAHT